MTFSGRYRYRYFGNFQANTDILTTKFCDYFSIKLTLKATLIPLQRKTIANASHNLVLFTNNKPDPAPRGGIPGPCPPKQKLCPPKRGLCPEKINRLEASGAQIEAQINVFCGLTPDFVTFLE